MSHQADKTVSLLFVVEYITDAGMRAVGKTAVLKESVNGIVEARALPRRYRLSRNPGALLQLRVGETTDGSFDVAS
jgi:hypothetical protein